MEKEKKIVKCILTIENSTRSKEPSLSISARSHIFPRISMGSFELSITPFTCNVEKDSEVGKGNFRSCFFIFSK